VRGGGLMGAVVTEPGVEVMVPVCRGRRRGNSGEFSGHRGGHGGAAAPRGRLAGSGRGRRGERPEDEDEVSKWRRKRRMAGEK
jgi:hypothetical protein